MNFLELCRQVKEEAGLSNTSLASVASTTGVDTKIVKWVQQAWERIQGYPWRTLYNEMAFTTTAGKRVYSLATDLLHTDVREFDESIAKIGDGSNLYELGWLDYHVEFRPKYFLSTPTSQRPRYVTYTRHDNTLQFESTPDAAYTVTLPYYMTAERLAANTDIPTLPEEMHWMIIWRAVMFYAAYDNAPGLYSTAEVNYREMLTSAANLMIGPIIIQAEPLA